MAQHFPWLDDGRMDRAPYHCFFGEPAKTNYANALPAHPVLIPHFQR